MQTQNNSSKKYTTLFRCFLGTVLRCPESFRHPSESTIISLWYGLNFAIGVKELSAHNS